MKSLVLFVEGHGDGKAIVNIVKRLLSEFEAWDILRLDVAPFRVGGLSAVSGNRKQAEWQKKLKAALKRAETAAVLLLLDGDERAFEGQPFCAFHAAATLAKRAEEIGAGKIFSVACVFACREFESWLLASIESLAGKPFPDGRPGVISDAPSITGDLEVSPRDAKGKLSELIVGGYKPTTDQEALANLVDFDLIRKRKLRSFERLESALKQICDAIRTDKHVASPTLRQ